MKIHLKLTTLILFLLFIISLLSCQQTQKKQTAKDKSTLTGWLTDKNLFELSPAYEEEKNHYLPDSTAVSFLKKFNKELNILIFLGTWCPDCRREVPRFLKIIENIDNNLIKYKMMGLDRTKRDSLGLAERYKIEYVPTFIILQNEKEIGRIVEVPMLSIEQDLVEIILMLKKD